LLKKKKKKEQKSQLRRGVIGPKYRLSYLEERARKVKCVTEKKKTAPHKHGKKNPTGKKSAGHDLGK